MRKPTTVLIVLMLVMTAGLVSAQTGPGAALAEVETVAELELSGASIHQAGPSSFYIRGVGIGESVFSLTFSQDSNGIWTLTSLNPESDNILPETTVLDFASLAATDDQTLKIDGVFVDGQVYSGSLTVGEEGDLELAGSVEAGSIDAVNEARARALSQLVVADTTAEFEQELAQQRAELQATIDQIEAQRDDYKAERDELEAERDELAEQLAELSAEAGSAGAASDTGAGDLGMIDLPETITVSEDSPVTAEVVAALINERNTIAGEMVGVLAENNQLRDEKKTLSEQIEDLQDENQRLRTELADMTDEVERLTELVEAYRSGSATVPAAEDGAPSTDAAPAATTATTETSEPNTPAWSMPGDYLRKSDLEAVAEAVTAELQSLEQRVAALEEAATGLADLEEALRTGQEAAISAAAAAGEAAATAAGDRDDMTPDPSEEGREAPAVAIDATAAEPEIARLTERLAELVEQNEELRRETQALENRILNDILENGLVAMMRERLTRTVNAGFAGSDPDVGDWNVSGNRAVQADSDAFFAKLSVPASQGDGPVLYSFRVRSLDPEGWVGVGLHFFVSDVERRRGYGMGRSLLVWLTRDPDVYKTRLTYLQLYRSDDDINMGRVMDSVIEEPMNTFLEVEVLYEPENQYLTVAIDGEDKIRYRTWFGIDDGVEVALRTLGAAEFRDFRIDVEP